MKTCILLVLTAFSLFAFEAAGGGGPPGPVQRGLPGTMMQRPGMAYEVELLVIKAGDMVALAQWSELAAVGYHVVGTNQTSDGMVLFLERAGQPILPKLPAVLEKDPAGAAALRSKIQALMTDRMNALRALQEQR